MIPRLTLLAVRIFIAVRNLQFSTGDHTRSSVVVWTQRPYIHTTVVSIEVRGRQWRKATLSISFPAGLTFCQFDVDEHKKRSCSSDSDPDFQL